MFLVENVESSVIKLVFLDQTIMFLGQNLVFLGENVMFGYKIVISGEKRCVFVNKTGISGAEHHILGENAYFWEKMSCFGGKI